MIPSAGRVGYLATERVWNTVPAIGALAQTATSYYIVQDVKTKKCTIVDKKPASTTEYTIVGSEGTVYKTKTEAENAMKTVKVCTTS